MNDEPPVDRKNWIHYVLVDLHVLTRVPSWALALAVLALASSVGGMWYSVSHSPLVSWLVGGIYWLAVAGDWAWLTALPRWGISFGPVKPSLIGLIGTRLFFGLFPLLGCAMGLSMGTCAFVSAALQLAIWGIVVYATRIEPFCLGVTHIELITPKLPAGKRVRLVQLSDLHVERITRREREVVERVNALGADYLLLTGDYLNLSYVDDAQAIADARRVLGDLRARGGIYAIQGTHQVDPNVLMPVLFDELPIRWLRNEHLTVGRDGYRMTFAGANYGRRRESDVPAVERALADVPKGTFTVLLYHAPDRVPEAGAGGVDLYLAGHTHGGQIRLPLYGALVTASDTGKRYEMGRYDIGDLTLYVSRGLGMEGMAAPRARFLCPPEIVCIDIEGSAG